MRTANDIINLGMQDNDLFVLLFLLEKGFGADRISDMTANIIRPDIVEYTSNFLESHSTNTEDVSKQIPSENIEATLPVNPFNGNRILLLPLNKSIGINY